jgi:hypothetical protein
LNFAAGALPTLWLLVALVTAAVYFWFLIP